MSSPATASSPWSRAISRTHATISCRRRGLRCAIAASRMHSLSNAVSRAVDTRKRASCIPAVTSSCSAMIIAVPPRKRGSRWSRRWRARNSKFGAVWPLEMSAAKCQIHSYYQLIPANWPCRSPQIRRGFAFLAQAAPACSTSGFAKAPECRFRSAEPVRPVCQSKTMFLADMSLLPGSPISVSSVHREPDLRRPPAESVLHERVGRLAPGFDSGKRALSIRRATRDQ